jgi:dTDP-4-amino-4,6-dideoxygalactose transaminase
MNDQIKRPFLPFALPDIGEEEIAEVVDSLRSGWITTGPKTRRFEQDFARFLGNDVQAVAVNSATAGLHLALEALGVGPGDQVITTTHTFTATAEVARYLGAELVFVDIDDSYCLDPTLVEAAVTSRTRAIIPVHYGGLACDMESLCDIARRRGLRIVEDAAHSFPTLRSGKLVGTLDTDCTVFSFYATKTIATGEGGMVVARDPDIVKRLRVMRLHGIDRDAFDRYTSTRPSWYYEIIAPGFKYNMTDLAASLGIHQLAKAERFAARRTELAMRYNQDLADLPLRLPPSPQSGSTHAWHLYVVSLDPSAGFDRNEVIQKLAELEIGASVHYIPLHQQPYWRERYKLDAAQFPVSQRLFENCISLPLYTRMSDADQSRVVEAMHTVLFRK